MCIATASMAAMFAGGAISAVGALQEGKAQEGAAKYNAAVGEQNALIAERNASLAAQSAEARAGMEGMKGKAQLGAIRAQQGASGIQTNTGSALQVQESAADLSRMDALTVRSNAIREAYGYQTKAVSDRAQATLDRYQGKNALHASYYKAAGTLLGSAGDAGSSYQQWKSASGGMTAGGSWGAGDASWAGG